MSKRRSPRKKRTEHIYGTTPAGISELGISIDVHTGEIQFSQPMVNTYSQVSYERAKGPKVVSRIPQSSAGLNFDSSAALFGNFDFLCAVDTNTRHLHGDRVSVVGVVTFRQGVPPPGAVEYWHQDVPFCWEFVNLTVDKPENFGWLAAWEELSHMGLITPETRVGMVVDSDLGNLPDFNLRTKPFFEKRLLPANLQLVYASADTGGESLINRVLRTADSVSSQVLDAIATGKVEPNSKRQRGPYFEGMRIVHPDMEIDPGT
jgi:hypothetical protein